MSSMGLVIPDLDGQFVIECDASGEGVGGALYQFVSDRLVPIWFTTSKKFNQAERNYSPRDRGSSDRIRLGKVFTVCEIEAIRAIQ